MVLVEPARTAPPSVAERLATVAWFPFAVSLTTARHLSTARTIVRRHEAGDVTDLPPALPAETVDGRSKPLADGYGPLFHRTFTVNIERSDVDASELMQRLVTDLDRPVPHGVMSFRKIQGRLGELDRLDEYRVKMPTPWDGPVRVVHRDAQTFRFATLTGHLEAGQIEFRARDTGGRAGGVTFEIETWSTAGDPVARLFYVDLVIGREVQLALWVQYALGVVRLSGGRRDGPVRATTRRLVAR